MFVYFLTLLLKLVFLSPNDAIVTEKSIVNIQINKCCKMDQILNSEKKCEKSVSNNWAPLIFMIDTHSTFERRGEFPANFEIQENRLPSCDKELLRSDNIVIFSNGFLYIGKNKRIVSPENYCADQNFVVACLPQENKTNKTYGTQNQVSSIRKCCGPHSAYDAINKNCLFIENKTHPLYNSNVSSNNLDLAYGFPDCSFHHGKLSKLKIKDLSEDSLTQVEKNIHYNKDYCLDHVISDNLSEPYSVKVFTCVEESTSLKNEDGRFPLYSFGLFVSSFFLLCTIIIVGFFMPSYHLLHWRCQINYIFCLMLGDLLLGISQIYKVQGIFCSIIALLMHFSFLSTFFWLNSMCINIWWTFRDFRPTSIEKAQELLRWRFFQIYSWVFPLVIVTIGAVFDNIKKDDKNNFVRPHFFDGETCWFENEPEILVYFYGPVGVILSANLLLFIFTAKQLTCGIWKSEDIKTSTEKTALGKVCIKLVIIMGITWIADIVSWVFKAPSYLWYFFDIINILQGVFIFCVVGCQPQVLGLFKRLWSTKYKPSTTTATNTPMSPFSESPSAAESTFTDTKSPIETSC